MMQTNETIFCRICQRWTTTTATVIDDPMVAHYCPTCRHWMAQERRGYETTDAAPGTEKKTVV